MVDNKYLKYKTKYINLRGGAASPSLVDLIKSIKFSVIDIKDNVNKISNIQILDNIYYKGKQISSKIPENLKKTETPMKLLESINFLLS